MEGVFNNVFGMFNMVCVVMESVVEYFVLVLMDKVVWFINVMGVLKCMVEFVL